MRSKLSSKVLRFTPSITAFVSITIVISIFWYLFTELILLKLYFIPESTRDGYKNPYLSFLGFLAVSVFIALIIYELINLIFFHQKTSIGLRVMVGLLSGVLPVGIANGLTFGLPFSDPGFLTELLMLSLSGALIPIVKQKLSIVINK